MDQFRDNTSRAEVSVGGVTPKQLARIRRHFGRHSSIADNVTCSYDNDSGELVISGRPAVQSDAEDVKTSFYLAIEAAQHIHPADDLDMSA